MHTILTPGTASSDQTICNEETPLLLTATAPTGGSGNFGYQWQFSKNSGFTWQDVAFGWEFIKLRTGISNCYNLIQAQTD